MTSGEMLALKVKVEVSARVSKKSTRGRMGQRNDEEILDESFAIMDTCS